MLNFTEYVERKSSTVDFGVVDARYISRWLTLDYCFIRNSLKILEIVLAQVLSLCLDVCYVAWQWGHIYVKKIFGFKTDGMVAGVLMLLGEGSERPVWYCVMVGVLKNTVAWCEKKYVAV